jgi:dTDP-4-amino-4,6-dideoxygalactose transaminase
VSGAIASRVWTGGRYTQAVETGMSELTGARFTVAFQSCTAAIHAALLAHGVRRGTPLHTPAFGFAGTLTGASHIGAALDYHDVEPDTGNSISGLPTSGHLVLTPDLHGVPHNLPREDVITDACQSLGTLVDGEHVGARGTHCWSFSATKLISAPDGGAVTTDDEALADELRQLRDYGAQRDAARANALVTLPGHNWRPSELSMALVAEQLHTFPRLAEQARETTGRVHQTLADCGLWHQQIPDGAAPAFHKLRTGLRDRPAGPLRLALANAGIPTHDWGQLPLPAHPMFAADSGSSSFRPIHAQRLAAETFCLGTETCPPWTWTSYETSLVCHTIELIMERL